MTRSMKLVVGFLVALACSCAGMRSAAVADKDDEPVCDEDYAIGSHFRERTCRTQAEIDVQSQRAHDMTNGVGSRGTGAAMSGAR